MVVKSSDQYLNKVKEGINKYLCYSKENGKIDEQLYKDALKNTFSNIEAWVNDNEVDQISPNLKKGLYEYIELEKWEDIVNAYRQAVLFGTGGIRGMMAFDKKSIISLKDKGVDATILKGTNTINDLVILLTSLGVAQYGRAQKPRLSKVVVGYDSRIRGYDFAALVAMLFLAYDYTVYFFDAPCPYPEVTFAIPNDLIKADIGVLISASHNDYRYNGYKLSCANGSQFDPEEREKMYEKYIRHSVPKDIKLVEFKDAADGKLYFLGGDALVPGFDYAGKEKNLINMHKEHREHIKKFLLTENLEEKQKKSKFPIHIGYCAFHGSGYIAVPRLLREVGFQDVKSVNGKMGLNELNGLFPAFRSDPRHEQQPDPGDPRAANTAVKAFKEDFSKDYKDLDILIGTDPDADRCGIIVKVPPEQRHIYGNKDYYLLPADDMWTLVLWYRLHREIEKYGHVVDADKKFVVLSHTTSDAITYLARKHGLGVVKSWVGFASLAASTRDVWNGKAADFINLVDGRNEKNVDLCHMFVCDSKGMDNDKRSINVAAMEQSNGFSILGGPPPDGRSLGVGGHVRDKDGTFAALLVAEIAAWAKEKKTSIIGLLDKHIYLDPDIGMFATFYEPDPMDGEYPGIEGDRIKKNILRRAMGCYQIALAGDLEIGGHKVKSAAIYRTGKYDGIYHPTHDFLFPDEGIRFFFDEEKVQHATIRPSGTGNSLRFHIQLHAYPKKSSIIKVKEELRNDGRRIMKGIRRLLRAPKK